MRVFIGCSSQGAQDLEDMTALISEAKMEPVPWSNPETFELSAGTWEQLVELTKTVEAAVFIFREDDEIKHTDRVVRTTRDNVILEFGLFTGALGPGCCAIARKGNPWIPVDLSGVTHIPFDSLTTAREKIGSWRKKMMNDREVTGREQGNLNEEQITAIARAMSDTKISRHRIHLLMKKLGVPEAEVDYFLDLRE